MVIGQWRATDICVCTVDVLTVSCGNERRKRLGYKFRVYNQNTSHSKGNHAIMEKNCFAYTLFHVSIFKYKKKEKKNTLTLCMLAKNCSRQHSEIFFLIFSQNIHFGISCKLSPASLGDNMHKLPKPIFWKN